MKNQSTGKTNVIVRKNNQSAKPSILTNSDIEKLDTVLNNNSESSMFYFEQAIKMNKAFIAADSKKKVKSLKARKSVKKTVVVKSVYSQKEYRLLMTDTAMTDSEAFDNSQIAIIVPTIITDAMQNCVDYCLSIAYKMNACFDKAMLNKPARKSISKKTKNGTVTVSRGSKVLLCSATSGAGQMELLLTRECGATLDEMRVLRGAVESHLNTLKKSGYNIVREGKHYFYRG